MAPPILVVSAVPFEHAALAEVARARPRRADPYLIHEGKIGRTPLLFLATGIGPAAAAGALGAVLAGREVRAVVNVGIAGTYAPRRLPLGSVCLVTAETFGDLGAEAPRGGWIGPAAMGFPLLPSGEDRIPCTLPRTAGLHLPPACLPAPGLTAGSVSHTLPMAARRARRWEAAIETMEGAALALVATRHRCPFVEVRGISNRAGDRDKRRWQVAAAAAAAQAAVRTLLEAGRIP